MAAYRHFNVVVLWRDTFAKTAFEDWNNCGPPRAHCATAGRCDLTTVQANRTVGWTPLDHWNSAASPPWLRPALVWSKRLSTGGYHYTLNILFILISNNWVVQLVLPPDGSKSSDAISFQSRNNVITESHINSVTRKRRLTFGPEVVKVRTRFLFEAGITESRNHT